MNQETKDFLIVVLILFFGAGIFLVWKNPTPPSVPESQVQIPASPSHEKERIICRMDDDLQDFVKCDRNNNLIRFYSDETKSKKLFEVEMKILLDECIDRECKDFAIPKEFLTIDSDQIPRVISIIIPDLVKIDDILDLIRNGFAENPPNMGDSIRLLLAAYPDKVFVAEFGTMDFEADVINYRRNKNKVIHLHAAPPKIKKEKGFSNEEKVLFYSFDDYKERLQRFLDSLGPTIPEDKDIFVFLQEIVSLSKDEKEQVVIFALDGSITFPKARSYALDGQGYSWFNAYQDRYNKDIGTNNTQCIQQGYQNCKLQHFWEENFAEYYIRQNGEKLIPSLNLSYDPNHIRIYIQDLSPFEDVSLQSEKERILKRVGELLKEEITEGEQI